MNVRELLNALADLVLVHGGDLPVLSIDDQEVHSIEYNIDEEPCVLILFEEDITDG